MTLKDHLIECDYYETDVIRNNMDVWLYMCCMHMCVDVKNPKRSVISAIKASQKRKSEIEVEETEKR